MKEIYEQYNGLEYPVWIQNHTKNIHWFNTALRKRIGLRQKTGNISEKQMSALLREKMPVSNTEEVPLVQQSELYFYHKQEFCFHISTQKHTIDNEVVSVSILQDCSSLLSSGNEQAFLSTVKEGVYGFALVNIKGEVKYANNALGLLMNTSETALVGKHISEIIEFANGWNWEKSREILKKVSMRRVDTYLVSPDAVPVEVTEIPVFYDTKKPHLFDVSLIIRDNKDRVELGREVEEARAQFYALFELVPSAMFITNLQSKKVLNCNLRASEILRREKEEIIGKQISDFCVDSKQCTEYMQTVEQQGYVEYFEIELKDKDSKKVWMMFSGRLMNYEDEWVILSMFVEVSEHKRREHELTQLAMVDILTGCLNRRFFMARAHEEFDRNHRGNHPMSVMLLDIDHFKSINDTYGHAAGDTALFSFAKVCKESLRSHDVLGRIGGEEFCILLPDTSFKGARFVAERVRQQVEKLSISHDNISIGITVSIGITFILPGDKDVSHVMERADKLLYKAKENGRNRVEVDIINK